MFFSVFFFFFFKQKTAYEIGVRLVGSEMCIRDRGDTVVETAMRYRGVPYVWGGSSPSGFDCSGLVRYSFAQLGVSLPHSSRAQFKYGTAVARDNLLPGDLVFFGSPIHHVGIYVGGGNMINAPYTGTNVRVDDISRRDYVGARRIK